MTVRHGQHQLRKGFAIPQNVLVIAFEGVVAFSMTLHEVSSAGADGWVRAGLYVVNSFPHTIWLVGAILKKDIPRLTITTNSSSLVVGMW